MKKTAVIGSITTLALSTALTVAGATVANAADCTPSTGTDPVFGAWAPSGHTAWKTETSMPDDPDGYAGQDNLLNTLQLGERQTRTVSNEDGRTEIVPGTPGLWSVFEPTDQHAPFDGPPSYPGDARGTWSAPKTEGGPDQAKSGVYQNGSGNGSWFYRQPGTPDRVVEHPATTHVEYRWVIQERSNVTATAPVTCDVDEEPPGIETPGDELPRPEAPGDETPSTDDTTGSPVTPAAPTSTTPALHTTPAVHHHNVRAQLRSVTTAVPTSIDAGL